jgi:hypothetical protein
MIVRMKGRILPQALSLCLAASALIFTSCETTQDRISKNPEIYQRLSASDQALVTQGQIRTGMSRNAVWLAWGSPDRKIVGSMGSHPTETWIYIYYATYPYYPYYGPWAPWSPWASSSPGPSYSFAYTSVGAATGSAHHHGGRNFVFFGSPFYDPFFYSYIPPSIPYPGKVVTFSNGRVMSFQYLASH